MFQTVPTVSNGFKHFTYIAIALGLVHRSRRAWTHQNASKLVKTMIELALFIQLIRAVYPIKLCYSRSCNKDRLVTNVTQPSPMFCQQLNLHYQRSSFPSAVVHRHFKQYDSRWTKVLVSTILDRTFETVWKALRHYNAQYNILYCACLHSFYMFLIKLIVFTVW